MATRRDDQTKKDVASNRHRSAQNNQTPSTESTQPLAVASARGGVPKHARPSDILSLQRTVGNRAVQRMIQRKLGRPTSNPAPPAPQTGPLALDMNAVITHAVTSTLSQIPQLQAHAYAQGANIHVAPGQEQHLPHEAWHVAQQKQGRVQPTMQLERADEQ